MRARHERLDRVRQVHPVDVVVIARHPDAVRLEQDAGVGVAGRRLEAVGGQQPASVGVRQGSGARSSVVTM